MESYYQANMELTRQTPSFSLDSNWPILTQNIYSLPQNISKQGNSGIVWSSPAVSSRERLRTRVLSAGVVIEEQAVVRNSVIMADAHVGFHSVIDDASWTRE